MNVHVYDQKYLAWCM